MTHQRTTHPLRPATRLPLLLPLLLAGACAGQQAAPAAPAPEAAPPAAEPEAALVGPQRIVRDGLAIEFSATAVSPDSLPVGEVHEMGEALIRLKITDAETGATIPDLRPLAWIDRRIGRELTAEDVCKDKVQMFLQGRLYPEGSIKAHADVDLNSFYVLTLNRTPNITVIDPILGFGRTKLRTTVLLPSPGSDWVMSEDHRRLFVAMPAVGRVAVVDTDSWKVVQEAEAGVAPTRIALHPDGDRLWVTNEPADGEGGGVTVLDASTLALAASIPTGAGEHVLAFDGAGHHAFVASRERGSVAVIDAHALEKVRDVATGSGPVALAFSPSDGAMYVAHQGDGAVVAIDAHSGEIRRRVQLEPGLASIAFPPSAQGHGGHGPHSGHGAAAAGPERYGFLANPETGKIYVVDASRGEVIRADSVGHAPDKVSFTASFAYVRSTQSSEISIIPLDQPVVGGIGSLDKFSAGQKAPVEAGPLGIPAAIASSPDMHDAVFVMNPADRMVYYYHYMEGMPIPSGGLTTYGFQPQAVMVARKGLRETEPGVYTATVRLTDRGDYDLVLVVDEPRFVECVGGGLAVRANPRLNEGRIALEVEPLVERRELRPGENVLRFRLEDGLTGKLLENLQDVGIVISAPGHGPSRAAGRAMEGGVYEFTPSVPDAGIYYVSFEIPSLEVSPRSNPPVIFRPAGALAQGGQDGR